MDQKPIITGIFKDAAFGDRYLTRNGRKAVFLHFWGNPPQSAIVYVEGYGQQECSFDGRVASGILTDRDITQRCTDNQWAHWFPEGYQSPIESAAMTKRF